MTTISNASSRTAVLLTLALAFAPTPDSYAAEPAAATITPTSAPSSWQGTALGGGAQNDLGLGVFGPEDLCEEGVTCDTFTLTVAGTPADWAAVLARLLDNARRALAR